jgi:hypothetical protein
MIRERGEILEEIRKKTNLSQKFDSWTKVQQEEFLDCCTGVKGMKLLYDAFFKEIMNPETVPERLNEFLSLLLGMEVEIVKVLPTDSSRLADESSLLIMDILVQMKDGTLANVEVQKLGYHFPGQRSACYSADLLLRQYKRIRGEQSDENTKKKFNYRSIKTVYTIVLFEQSEKIFHQFPDTYLHYFEQCSNTGLKLELLQKYLFIPLDIFKKTHHNKTINNKLDAWLMFFSTDEPDEMIRLLEVYPEFRKMYEEVYELCRNMENVMETYSKELLELDRGTVQYMIDEMQDEIDKQKKVIEQKEAENRKYKEELEELQRQLRQLKKDSK